MEPWEIAVAYHQRTKHRYDRHARSLGFMDWANQPEPFRHYQDTPTSPLPLGGIDHTPEYDEIFTPGAAEARPLNLQTLGSFFELSLAISAWKEYQGSRWALRVNPSSGNLHPTEGYAVLPAIAHLHDCPGVYHYAPERHTLERRAQFSEDTWRRLNAPFPAGTYFVGLSSIHWRELWKYGERGYRYCQHDTGHAVAACSIAAASNGWTLVTLDEMSAADIAALLGLDRERDYEDDEPEAPGLLAAVLPGARIPDVPRALPREAIGEVAAGTWSGKANRLSRERVDWEVVTAVHSACTKPTTGLLASAAAARDAAARVTAGRAVSSRRVIRERRSAVAMDGMTTIDAERLYLILSRTLPVAGQAPWDALAHPVAVNLVLFVHRVNGIPPGLYCLVRSPDQETPLKRAMHKPFAWTKPEGCPEGLPLYLLQPCDCRALSGRLSCHQAIASDGAFSAGMVAEFEGLLKQHGAWLYPRLFWEAGMIGQVLYLEAEAGGVRGTGIGCFFDDEVHETFGLSTTQYQSLYHFTIGGAVEDERLTTLPAYTASPRDVQPGA